MKAMEIPLDEAWRVKKNLTRLAGAETALAGCRAWTDADRGAQPGALSQRFAISVGLPVARPMNIAISCIRYF
jgi:hypothetical protein